MGEFVKRDVFTPHDFGASGHHAAKLPLGSLDGRYAADEIPAERFADQF
jgi:hypothetical protein